MRFYQRCLGGELTITSLGDTPMKDQFPEPKHERVINAHLKSEAVEISASDWMASPSYEPVQGNMSAIFLTSDSHEQLRAAFDRLRDGENNARLQDLHEMPFGVYGQFYDRYGVQWIFRGKAARP